MRKSVIMPSPKEANLAQETFAIAAGKRAQEYDVDALTPSPDEHMAYAVTTTVIYTAPERPDHLLHRANFDSPRFASAVASSQRNRTDQLLRHRVPIMPAEAIRSDAEDIASVCEEIASQHTGDPAFKIVGVLAAYLSTEGVSLGTISVSRSFTEKLVQHQPKPRVPEGEELEKVLREMYARESEHKSGLAPFDEWRGAALQALAVGQKQGAQLLAFGKVACLLLPASELPAGINERLFTPQN